jgi:nitroreductase
MKDSEVIRQVDRVIRSRKTLKVLADGPKRFFLDQAVVESLLEAAGWAPFHRPAAKQHCESGDLTSKVPWRFYVLDGTNCKSLRDILLTSGDTTKIPALLATATNLIQVTWLPNKKQDDEDRLFDPSLENMEHIAAASAAIQNLLIAATAREIQTYWSSGGGLRKPETMARLGVPEGEILLGSIFLFGPLLPDCETAPGKLREQRGKVDTWAKWVEVS